MKGTSDNTAGRPPGSTGVVRELLAQLQRIDRLIKAHVAAVRPPRGSEGQYQGLFIPEEEIDELLARAPGSLRFPPVPAQEEPATPPRTTTGTDRSRLGELGRLFHLTPFEADCILVCLAPELDPRYERLYAYLQDDVTKKRPSVELVLNLLSPTFEAKVAGRQRFLPGSTLIRWKLLQPFDDPSQPYPTLLGKYLRIDERIVSYLLGSDEPDGRLLPWVARVEPKTSIDDLVMAPEKKARLSSFVQSKLESRILFYFQGPPGSGRQTVAEAFCSERKLNLLAVDGKHLSCGDEATFQNVASLAAREALLQGAALYWNGFDTLLPDEKGAWRSILLRELDSGHTFSFLAGEAAWHPTGEVKGLPFLRLEFERPSYSERVQLWEKALEGSHQEIGGLANKFRFTPGQINGAAATARNLACWRDPGQATLCRVDLDEACRIHSGHKLATLGRKIKPRHTWNDIVLPDDRLQHLREICNSIKYRSIVFDQWGFDRKLSLGKGLNILFAGPSGTGKTMAAEIMAGELALDLYKIDLSTVVSKYIGETEKNLARIFAEAETSNAILFFDEADALFGRRSEVRDSHDRYANIEINYLLQKMEEHEGAVILATNFRKNMDDAFVRRIHFTVEFPFPNEEERRKIWQRIWPAETPQAAELDLDLMARRFEIAGGNIRNIALAAAFLAANDGGVVNMTHLLHGTRREYQKMGKVVMQGEFE
jgi:AAA+ superfamily predicted ATPase